MSFVAKPVPTFAGHALARAVLDQAHKADEFIAISELEKCGVFLDRLIALCAR